MSTAKSWPPLVLKAPRRDSLSSPGEIFLATKNSRSSWSTVLHHRGVAVDDGGFIFVADSGNNRIQIFNPDGTFLRAFGRWGQSDGEFKVTKVLLFETILFGKYFWHDFCFYLQCWISGTGRHCGEQQREHFSCGQRKPSDTDLLMKAPF